MSTILQVGTGDGGGNQPTYLEDVKTVDTSQESNFESIK